jgi:hypothetical protein
MNGGAVWRTFVFAGPSILGWLWHSYNNAVMVWRQRDPSNASDRGYGEQELDPLGADAGTFATTIPPVEDAISTFGTSYDPANPNFSYSIDGIRVPVEDFVQHAGIILKDPLALLEWMARKSAIPIGRLSVGVSFGHNAEMIYDANGKVVYEKWWYDSELSQVSYGVEYNIYSNASFALDKIPKGTLINKADVGAYRERVKKMISNPNCKKFLQEILEEAKAQTGKSYGDILTTFDTIKFFWGDTGSHGGFAHFVWDTQTEKVGTRAATLSDTIVTEKPSGSLANRRDRRGYLISYTTNAFLGETLHHVGADFAYDDAVMANAVNSYRVKNKLEKPRTFSSLTETEVNDASMYWHPKVWAMCPAPRN